MGGLAKSPLAGLAALGLGGLGPAGNTTGINPAGNHRNTLSLGVGELLAFRGISSQEQLI